MIFRVSDAEFNKIKETANLLDFTNSGLIRLALNNIFDMDFYKLLTIKDRYQNVVGNKRKQNISFVSK